MDFAEIGRRTNPETAQKLQSNDYFNAHIAMQKQEIDAERLDDLTRGAVILGVETIDYPLTDGLCIYVKRPAEGVIAIWIETNADKLDGGYDVLRISEVMIE